MLPLAETATATAPAIQAGGIPIVGGQYPWGANPADEAAIYAVYALGKRWIDAHYDAERRDLRDTIARMSDDE